MANTLATVITASILAVLCLCKAPPTAWEQAHQNSSNTTSSDIPYTKVYRKCCWYIHPPKRLKGFEASVSEISRSAKSYKKIKPGFEALKRSSRRIYRQTAFAASAENRAKNRNSHLFAFDETRSCQDIPNFYINANDVLTPVQSYMVTQGPLDTTITDFWKAILHKNSSVIVTLVMAVEDGKDKCASYWTIPELECDGWKLTLQQEQHIASSKLIPSHRIVVREFTAKNASETRSIKQVHYENWPDGRIPDLDLFVKLLDVVDGIADNPQAPITVHCSAGIGRSGTFVAAHSLRKEMRQANECAMNQDPVLINIPKAIFHLRCQRMGMVGSTSQFRIVYQALAKEHTIRTKPFFVL